MCKEKRECYASARQAEENMLRISNNITSNFKEQTVFSKSVSHKAKSKLNKEVKFMPKMELKTLKQITLITRKAYRQSLHNLDSLPQLNQQLKEIDLLFNKVSKRWRKEIKLLTDQIQAKKESISKLADTFYIQKKQHF